MTEENKTTGGGVAPETTRPETPSLDNEVKTDGQAPEEVTVQEEPKSEVEEEIASRLGEEAISEGDSNSDTPTPASPKLIDLNNLTQEQIQDLQELFANTPRRSKVKETYHTIELRQIDGKYIVEWGNTYFDLKTDPVQRRDVMKTMIPVRFHGSDDFVDILWKEDFMSAERATCKILNMEKKEVPEVVGKTFKRDSDGGLTSQEVEMYVNKVEITLTIQLPNGETTTINGKYAN